MSYFWFDLTVYHYSTIRITSVFFATAVYSLIAKYYVAHNVCIFSTIVKETMQNLQGIIFGVVKFSYFIHHTIFHTHL